MVTPPIEWVGELQCDWQSVCAHATCTGSQETLEGATLGASDRLSSADVMGRGPQGRRVN